MTTLNIEWFCCKDNNDKHKVLEEILPRDYNYQVTAFQLKESSNICSESKFSATFNINICTEDGLQAFLQEFNGITNTSYNMLKADNRKAKTLLVSGGRKCIHNVRKRRNNSGDMSADKSKGKQTACNAQLKFKLKKTIDHSDQPCCPNFPLEVTLLYEHNHSIWAADAMKYQNVSSQTKEKFISLFQEGHSASSAYYAYRDQLMAQHGNKYVEIAASRSILPDYKWVFYQEGLFKHQRHGHINSPESYRLAEEIIEKYNIDNDAHLCQIRQPGPGEYYVVCIDKLASRVHECVPQSGDIVMIDATSSLDRQDSKFFRLLCCSPVGGLPLGFILISSENENLLTQAFMLFKQMLPSHAFYKRGDDGPILFISDDARAEINMLNTVWPKSTHLLCIWHLLQAVWRFLFDAKNNVKKCDRPQLLQLFRCLVFAPTRTEYDNAMETLLESEIISQYPNYLRHLQDQYFSRVHKWALYIRIENQLPTNNINTNNYIESSFREGLKKIKIVRNFPNLVRWVGTEMVNIITSFFFIFIG